MNVPASSDQREQRRKRRRNQDLQPVRRSRRKIPEPDAVSSGEATKTNGGQALEVHHGLYQPGYIRRSKEEKQHIELKNRGVELYRQHMRGAGWVYKKPRTMDTCTSYIFQSPHPEEDENGKKKFVEGTTQFTGYAAIASKYKELGERRFVRLLQRAPPKKPKKKEKPIRKKILEKKVASVCSVSTDEESDSQSKQKDSQPIRQAVPESHSDNATFQPTVVSLPFNQASNTDTLQEPWFTDEEESLHDAKGSANDPFSPFSMVSPSSDMDIGALPLDLWDDENEVPSPSGLIAMDPNVPRLSNHAGGKMAILRQRLVKLERFFLGQEQPGILRDRVSKLEEELGATVGREQMTMKGRIDDLSMIRRRIFDLEGKPSDTEAVQANPLLERVEAELLGDVEVQSESILKRLQHLEAQF